MKKALLLLLILCLISLTACSAPRTVVKKEYVPAVVPDLPSAPAYYPVRFHGSATPGWYWMDEVNAKNLLKNFEIMRSYQDELRRILEGLQSSGALNGRN